MVGAEHFLKISAPQLLPFGIDSALKMLNERITQLVNQSQRCLQNSPGYTGSVNKCCEVFLLVVSNLSYTNTISTTSTTISTMVPRFTIWYYPAIIYVDKSLVGRTLVERDTAEFGKHPVITSFLKNSISVRRAEVGAVDCIVV